MLPSIFSNLCKLNRDILQDKLDIWGQIYLFTLQNQWKPPKNLTYPQFILFTEYIKTKCVHSNSGSNRRHGGRLLAYDLAGTRRRHRHAHQNLRLHQGKPIFNISVIERKKEHTHRYTIKVLKLRHYGLQFLFDNS